MEARALGEVVPARGTRPRSLVGLIFVAALILAALLISAPIDWSRRCAMVALPIAWCAGLALGWPRLWVYTFNVMLLQLWGGAMQVGFVADEIGGAGTIVFAAAILIVLNRAEVRRWFLQQCPTCDTMGARPVWSVRRGFSCVHCGSCWTAARARPRVLVARRHHMRERVPG